MTKKKSDLSRAFSEDGARKTHVGGQALLEGVMMRGKYNWAVGVREPDGGIYIEEHDLTSGKKKYAWMRWPLVRGCVALVESLVLGYKALEIAAMHAFSDEEIPPSENSEALRVKDSKGLHSEAMQPSLESQQEGFAEGLRSEATQPSLQPSCEALGKSLQPSNGASSENTQPSFRPSGGAFGNSMEFSYEKSSKEEALQAAQAAQATSGEGEKEEPEPFFSKGAMLVSMALGVVLGIALFIVAPAFLTNLIVGEYDSNTILWNVIDGLLRVAIFIFYLWLIGRMGDIKRMFGYHGAEHKTIHCYEHGLELTPENARSFPRLHVRCGTAFLIMVMIIAIFVYTVIPLNPLIAAWGVPDGILKLLLVIAVRIIFMPVIAGISYEITVKWAGKRPDNPLVKVILWPGMQMQYLTTNEPDDSMLECAIASMKCVLAREEAEEVREAEDFSVSAAPHETQHEASYETSHETPHETLKKGASA